MSKIKQKLIHLLDIRIRVDPPVLGLVDGGLGVAGAGHGEVDQPARARGTRWSGWLLVNTGCARCELILWYDNFSVRD